MSGAKARAALAAVVAVGVATLSLTACGGNSTSTTSRTTEAAPPAKAESAVPKAAFVSYPRAPASQQTAPTVAPRAGNTSTIFTLHLTARRALGAQGYARYDYRVYLVGPRPRCAEFTEVTAAKSGARVGVALRPPIELGWCRGTFAGTVLLETNPSCPPAPTGGRTRPCPTFKTRLQNVGHFKFVTS